MKPIRGSVLLPTLTIVFPGKGQYAGTVVSFRCEMNRPRERISTASGLPLFRPAADTATDLHIRIVGPISYTPIRRRRGPIRRRCTQKSNRAIRKPDEHCPHKYRREQN
jgi:hypothetical protein